MEFTTRLELHSQTTRLVEGASRGRGRRPRTGFSPSATSCSKALGPAPRPKRPLQITTRAPGAGSDFKFELLPLHSPLLRQSRLVSCPPLIDMLKFSGYPCLIRGQTGHVDAAGQAGPRGRTLRPRGDAIAREVAPGPPLPFGPVPRGKKGGTAAQHRARAGSRGAMTLGQACPPECRGAQCAFKDSMIR